MPDETERPSEPGCRATQPPLVVITQDRADGRPDQSPGDRGDDPNDDRRFSKGLLIGLLLAAPFWCAVAMVIWWFFR